MKIRSKAPLRLGLAGGGTDLASYCNRYGGYVLNATIDLYAYCTLEFLDNGKVCFHATDRDEHFECESREFLDLDGTLDLHKATYNRIVKQYNGNRPMSIKLTTYSDTPAGSGLGSSSTMVVAIVKAFVEAMNLPLGEYDIAQLAFEIERIDVGLSGGKQDQYAATFGGFNCMEFYHNNQVIVNPLRVKNWIINELESSIILYYTGVSRESAKIIDEQSNNIEEKKEMPINALHMLKKDATVMKEAILSGNIHKIASCLSRSWGFKKTVASNISNNTIDSIIESAIQAGAMAGKVSGAGGGGFIIFIVDPINRIQVLKELEKSSGKVVNFHFEKNGTQGWRVE